MQFRACLLVLCPAKSVYDSWSDGIRKDTYVYINFWAYMRNNNDVTNHNGQYSLGMNLSSSLDFAVTGW